MTSKQQQANVLNEIKQHTFDMQEEPDDKLSIQTQKQNNSI